MNARTLAPLLVAAVLASCGGGDGGDGAGNGGGDGRPTAGAHQRPPEDLSAPARSIYGTAYNICLNRSEDDIGDDPRETATEIAQQFSATYREAGLNGCLGAFADRGLITAP